MDFISEFMSSLSPKEFCGLFVVAGMFLGLFVSEVYDLVLVAIGYLRDKREALKNK